MRRRLTYTFSDVVRILRDELGGKALEVATWRVRDDLGKRTRANISVALGHFMADQQYALDTAREEEEVGALGATGRAAMLRLVAETAIVLALDEVARGQRKITKEEAAYDENGFLPERLR